MDDLDAWVLRSDTAIAQVDDDLFWRAAHVFEQDIRLLELCRQDAPVVRFAR